MCDLGSVGLFNSGMSPGARAVGLQLPGTEAAKSGGLSAGEWISGIGGVLGQFGEAEQYGEVAAQREARAGQILTSTQKTLDLKALEQSRAKGRTVRAIGRSGVTQTGSASRLLANQDLLDEMALEAAKQRGVLQIGGEIAEAQAAESKRDARLMRGFAQGFGLVREGFDF